jgi:hypothetical protein
MSILPSARLWVFVHFTSVGVLVIDCRPNGCCQRPCCPHGSAEERATEIENFRRAFTHNGVAGRVIDNRHSADVASPPPPPYTPRVCTG